MTTTTTTTTTRHYVAYDDGYVALKTEKDGDAEMSSMSEMTVWYTIVEFNIPLDTV